MLVSFSQWIKLPEKEEFDNQIKTLKENQDFEILVKILFEDNTLLERIKEKFPEEYV